MAASAHSSVVDSDTSDVEYDGGTEAYGRLKETHNRSGVFYSPCLTTGSSLGLRGFLQWGTVGQHVQCGLVVSQAEALEC